MTGGDGWRLARLQKWHSLASSALLLAQRRPAVTILISFLVTRILTLAIAHLVLLGWGWGESKGLLGVLLRWDAYWYLGIATEGYSTAEHPARSGAMNVAFFPLLPLMMRGVSAALGLSALHAGLLLANAFFLGGLFLVYRYAIEAGAGRQAAVLSAVLLCITPQSVVFSAVYTESLFLFFVAAAMLLFRRRAFIGSALAAALSTAVRFNAIFIVVFFAVTVLQDWIKARRVDFDPWPLLPVLAAPLGTVAFYWYLYFLTGDAFAQANSAAHGWGRTLDPTFPLLFELAFAGHQPIMLWALGSLAAAIALTVLLFRQGFVAEGAMVLCTVVFFAMANLPQSMLRYLTPLFPLYIALAVTLLRKPVLLWPTMIALAGLNVFVTSRWSLSSVLAS